MIIVSIQHVYTIEHWKNKSLENLVEEFEGIVYTEEWKDISGYEGLYTISTFGRIFSLIDNVIIGQTKETKTVKPRRLDYCIVYLKINGQSNRERVHRLSLLSFKGNPPTDKHIGMHDNDIPYDNRIKNLSWGTHKQNVRDCFSKNRMPINIDTLKRIANIKRKNQRSFFAINVLNGFKKEFKSLRPASKELHFAYKNIIDVLKGNSESYKGFKFEYVKEQDKCHV